MSAESLPYGIAPPGYRLPSGMRLGAVRLQVADLDRSLTWYRQVLGPVLLDGDDLLNAGSRTHRVARLGVPDSPGALIELYEQPGATPVPPRGRLGLYHYAILLPDRAALGRFLRHLSITGVRAGMSNHLVSEAIYLTDPDGLGIEVYADRPRSAWQRDGRQLVMSTQPLDVEDLSRAAGDTPWSGLPPGTVLGHVHLFVADLERAAAFYHRGLGLDQTVWSYPGALFMSAGGYHHHLGTNTWAQGAISPSSGEARLLEWEIVLPTPTDTSAALASLEAVAGAGSVERTADGGVTHDPWGTTLRLRTSA